ncbi:MAG: DsbE family thiol:disulfide interchange protein, partial [bacterium]
GCIMNRFIWPFVIFIALVGLLYVGLSLNPREVPSPLIGKAAPGFNLPDLHNPGKTVSPEAMRGKPWLLNVWGTWCPECWKEHAYLVELAGSGKIQIVGLNWKDDAAEAQSMLARLGNPFVMVGVDQQGNAAIDWGVYGAPETFLVDAQGIVRVKHTGAMTPTVWEQKFVPLL